MRTYITKSNLEIHFTVVSPRQEQTFGDPGFESEIEINDILENNTRTSDKRFEYLMAGEYDLIGEILDSLRGNDGR